MHVFRSCGLTLDKGKCRKGDLRFTFQGSVGIVTALDNTNVIPQVFVTFNNGRTSYKFPQSMVKLETYPKSMYGESEYNLGGIGYSDCGRFC